MDINSMTPTTGRILDEDGKAVNVVDILNAKGSVAPVSDKVYDINAYSPKTGRVIGEDGKAYNLVDLLENGGGGGGGGGGGTTDHSKLSNLSYEKSGHTGFVKTMELDVTATPAPPSLPRTNGWRIGATGQVQGDYNYLRAFYTTKEAAEIDDTSDIEHLIAVWAILGKEMVFAHVADGELHDSKITDADGNVLIEELRPIPEGYTWWFGGLQPYNPDMPATPFPTDDVFFSILEIGVESLMTMIGDTFQLKTDNKDLVGAVNELLSKANEPKVENIRMEAVGDDALSIRQGSVVFKENGEVVNFSLSFALTTANLDSVGFFVVGQDYYVYICDEWDSTSGGSGGNIGGGENGTNTANLPTILISTDNSAPLNHDISQVRKIGGFHYGTNRRTDATLQPINTAGAVRGDDWEANVYSGIVPRSVWTFQHRPKCEPEGMVYLGNNVWVDIYQASDDTGGTEGFLSAHNALPSVGLTWYAYVERLLLSGKRLLSYQEWIQAALGSPQGTSSGNLNAWTSGTDRQLTGFVERAVSSIGCRDCVGNVWEWLSELIASGSGTEAWQDPMSGQGYGQMWLSEDNNFRALLAGGSYFNGALVGARSACVLYNPWGDVK